MTNVVICDRQELRRLGIVSALAASDIDVAAEIADDDEAQRRINGLKPDVLIVGEDHDLGALSDTVRILSPDTKIVALAKRSAGPGVWREAVLQTDALILDDEHYTRLVSAVQCVGNGDVYVDGDVARAMITLREENVLSPREQEVISLLAQGFTNREIGEQLFLSVRTVESHRAQLMNKLGLGSRHELVEFAVENGLFPVAA